MCEQRYVQIRAYIACVRTEDKQGCGRGPGAVKVAVHDILVLATHVGGEAASADVHWGRRVE